VLILQTWDDYAAIHGKGVNATQGYLAQLEWRPQGNVSNTTMLFTGVTTIDRDLARLHPTEGATSMLPSAWYNSTLYTVP
jgi:hypothetical protein